LKLKIDFDIPKNELAAKWPTFFTIGSCFADNQSTRMKSLGLNVRSNPFGILYNPVSIEKIFERSLNSKMYTAEEFEQQNTHFSWEHHGDFKYPTTAEAVLKSNSILQDTRDKLANAEVIVITYGTSLVFTRDCTVVANCHKVPNKEFKQKQLSFNEVKTSIQHTLDYIWCINPDAKIIFTVSPIRHLRSGVMESSRSKATLLSALHEVISEEKRASYFPSYEIFMDELRDYRFAKTDMTHPTEQSEDYIWDKFCTTYFSENTVQILKEVKKYTQFAAHRPIHSTELHEKQVAEKLSLLTTNYPFLHFK
jgi:hypothetical protein